MPTLISLYGGTKLKEQSARFAGELARAFLGHSDVVLVSGGFSRWLTAEDRKEHESLLFARAKADERRKDTSVDFAVADAAEATLKHSSRGILPRFQTWLPQTPRPGVQRFQLGRTKVLPGSPRARRRQLVQGVDALVTLEGDVQTALVLETALTAGRLALPIGFTGGDSGMYWRDEREALVESLGLTNSLANRIDESPRQQDERRLAEKIAEVVVAKTVRRCLVIMGFSKERQQFYSDVIEPAIIASDYAPIRLKESEVSGHIATKFQESLRHCARIIADVTDLNPNVMYELGHVHHAGSVEPLILTEAEVGPEMLPFYLREYQVKSVGRQGDSEARPVIKQYLESI